MSGNRKALFRRRLLALTVAGLAPALASLDACTYSLAHTPISLTYDQADVRVTVFDTPTVLRRGQTLGIKPPSSPGPEWQVEFDTASLRLVTPVSDLAVPGARGWVWRALRVGQSELVFTSVARCPEPPCAANVARFTMSIEIKPE